MCYPFLVLALSLLACGQTPRDATDSVHFTEITSEAGLDFVHYNGFSGEYYYVETFGAGAAFFDYDADGWQDLYLVNGTYLTGHPPDPRPVNRLYHNSGEGTFADVTASSATGDPGYGFGCAAADYDADGDQDLFVANYGPNAFYRNDGAGRFADVTDQAGVDDARWSSSAGFLRLRPRRRPRPLCR